MTSPAIYMLKLVARYIKAPFRQWTTKLHVFVRIVDRLLNKGSVGCRIEGHPAAA